MTDFEVKVLLANALGEVFLNYRINPAFREKVDKALDNAVLLHGGGAISDLDTQLLAMQYVFSKYAQEKIDTWNEEKKT